MTTTALNAPFLDSNTFDERRNILLTISEDGQTPSQNNAQLASYDNSNDWDGFFAVNGVYARNPGVLFTEDFIRYEFLQTNTNNVDIVASEGDVAKNLTIDETVTINGIVCNVLGIRDVAFQSRSLTALTINSPRLKRIRASAFRNNNIGSLTFGNQVTGLETIEIDAFNNAFNDNLKAITIPASVLDIGDSAFTNNNIEEVTLLRTTVTGVDSDAFTNRRDIRLQVPDAAVNAYKEDAQWSSFFSINGNYIGTGRDFTENEIIYRITPEKNIANIIGSRDIPNTLTVPTAVTFNQINFATETIENEAFQNQDLISVTIPEGIRTIREQAFRGNDIATLNLPKTLTTIESNAFRGNQIVDLTLSSGIETLGSDAFNENPMTKITSENPEPPSVEANTFRDRSLINLSVPVGSAQAYEFGGWDGFKNNIEEIVVIGQIFTIDGLDYEIISVAPNQVSLTGGTPPVLDLLIPETVTSLGFDFTVTSLGFDFTVTSIGEAALRGKGLTRISIPDSVTTIEDNAFRENNLVAVNLGSGVTAIGENAFDDNITLQEVIITAQTPPTLAANSTFNNPSIPNAVLTVPVVSLQAYQEDPIWSRFNTIITPEIILLTLKVFLQGATLNPIAGEEDLMRDDLRTSGLVPTISPFNTNDINSAVLDIEGAAAIVDWVFAEFRDENNNLIGDSSFLLQRDGTLRGGPEPKIIVPREVLPETILIAIYHRNHIPIITNPVATTEGNSITVDFTDPNQVQGGENALVEISEGKFAMIAGDFDENGQIQPSDVNDTTAAIGIPGYSQSDMDMNGQTQPADVNNLVNPNVGRGAQFTTAE